MAQREPKSKTTTTIDVVGRTGKKMGRLDITSGNVSYYRDGAKKLTGQWTPQQLIAVLEKDLTYAQSLQAAPTVGPLSKPALQVCVQDSKGTLGEPWGLVVDEVVKLGNVENEHALGRGMLQVESPRRPTRLGLRWTMRIGILTALYIVDLYVRKRLTSKRAMRATDKDTPVSRHQVLQLLHNWQKAIAP